MSNQVKRVLIILGLVAIISPNFVIWWLGKREVESSKKVAAELSENLATLKMQYEGLHALVREDGKLLALEKELIRISRDRDKRGLPNLGFDTPAVAIKLLELTERYKDEGLELSLLLGIISQESDFDPKATSTFTKDGKTFPLARGLMQTTDSTSAPYLREMHLDPSPNTLYNPLLSLEVGVRVLMDAQRSWVSKGLADPHDWHLSVSSYFWGEPLIAMSLDGPTSKRDTFASQTYWVEVKKSQMKWKEQGF